MAKPCKPSKPASSHNTGEIVLSAIKKLMRNTGWTSRTIIKFIKREYRLPDSNLSRKVSRALKRGVKIGLLMMNQGRYRLNDMSRLARSVSARDVRKPARREARSKRKERPLRMRSRTASDTSSQ